MGENGENDKKPIVSPYSLGRQNRSTNIWIDDGDKMILKSYKPLLKTSMTGVNHVLLGTGARCFEEKHLQTIEGLEEKTRIQALIVNNRVTLRRYADFLER